MMNDIDPNILHEVSEKIDLILDLCQKDLELQPFAFKFQFEQASDKAAFESRNEERECHMERVLQQMSDLAREVASYVLDRSISHSQQKNDKNQLSSNTLAGGTLRVSSVDDFTAGGEAWMECSANVSFLCSSVLSLVILSNKSIRKKIQVYLLEHNVLEYVINALKISKEHEINYFLEGHKTELLRLLANMSFENSVTSKAMAENDELLMSILSSTRIDEENPGLGEWAKFTIRNICHAAESAREKIKRLQALNVDPNRTPLDYQR